MTSSPNIYSSSSYPAHTAWIAVIDNNPTLPIECKFYKNSVCLAGRDCCYEHYTLIPGHSPLLYLPFKLNQIYMFLTQIITIINYNSLRLNEMVSFCVQNGLLSNNIEPTIPPLSNQQTTTIPLLEPIPIKSSSPHTQSVLSAQAPTFHPSPPPPETVGKKMDKYIKTYPFTETKVTDDFDNAPSTRPSIPHSTEPVSSSPPLYKPISTDVKKATPSKRVTSEIEAENKREAEIYRKDGNTWFKAKNYDKAIFFYSQAIQLDPSNHLNYSNRSAAYRLTDQLDKALDDATRCVKLAQDFQRGYIRMGQVYIAQKNYNEASNVYNIGCTYCNDTNLLETAMKSLQKLRKSGSK